MRALRATAPPLARRWPRLWFRWFELLLRPNVPKGIGREALVASLAAWSADSAGAEAFMRNAPALDPRITEEIGPRLAPGRVPPHVGWGERDPFPRGGRASKVPHGLSR